MKVGGEGEGRIGPSAGPPTLSCRPDQWGHHPLRGHHCLIPTPHPPPLFYRRLRRRGRSFLPACPASQPLPPLPALPSPACSAPAPSLSTPPQGHQLSEETRQKISAARRGRSLSLAHRFSIAQVRAAEEGTHDISPDLGGWRVGAAGQVVAKQVGAAG